MKALISTEEEIYQNNELIGYRVAQVSDTAFDVAPSLFWVDCNEDVIADRYYYSKNNEIIKKSIPSPEDKPKPTLEQLQAQLTALTNQINALASGN